MGIHSPLRATSAAHVAGGAEALELELFDEAECRCKPQQCSSEARALALPLCSFAGGPPVARHLAAVSRTWHKAVSEVWDELTLNFPCRLYVVGGLDTDFRPLSCVNRFDPLTGVWESLPKLPGGARTGPCAAAAAGRLYVLGGERRGRALSDARRYDAWLDKWEALPAMHEGRVRAAAVACGGYLYVLGGLDGTRPLRSAERYDMINRVWEVLPQMHKARYGGAASVQGHRIFAIGGDFPDGGGAPSSSVEVYDTQAGRWELLPALQSTGCGSAVAADSAGRRAFLVGGLGLSGQALGQARHLQLDHYVCGIDEGEGWSPIPAMPTPRHLVSVAAFGGGVVALGGKGATFKATDSVEFFNVAQWGWQVLPPLPSPRMRSAVVGGRL